MKKKLLIVEDNEKLLSSMSTLLEDHYEVTTANNGRDGIDSAKLHIPDIIISDIMMPEASGYELVEEVKANEKTRHIPIILLTALGEDEKMIEGYDFGADDYIVKPFKLHILLSRLDNLLEQRKLLKGVYDKAVPVHHEFGVKHPTLTHVEALVVNHFKFKNFSIPQIAEMMNLTPSKLEREIKRLTGMTPIKYINDFRLTKAKHMLTKGDKTIFEVSYTLGFKSMSYFGKAYKEKFGIAPSKTTEV
jgi:DNA-binding response OmpR family regulator